MSRSARRGAISIAAILAASLLGIGEAMRVGQISLKDLAIGAREVAPNRIRRPKDLFTQRSGRKGKHTRRKKHRGPKPIRSWRKARVQKLRARRR